VTFDVLKKDDSKPHGSNSICDKWPEVPGIFVALSFAGG
jgi:hypothetical protein